MTVHGDGRCPGAAGANKEQVVHGQREEGEAGEEDEAAEGQEARAPKNGP